MNEQTGEFIEGGLVHETKHQGHAGQGVALTAFVLLAFKDRPDSEEIIQKASDYLEDKFKLGIESDDLFTLAITTYALAVAGKREVALQAMQELNTRAIKRNNGKFWKDQTKLDVVTAKSVETTAYALLAIQELAFAEGEQNLIVNWLLSQRNDWGGFISTQVRMMPSRGKPTANPMKLRRLVTLQILKIQLLQSQWLIKCRNVSCHRVAVLPYQTADGEQSNHCITMYHIRFYMEHSSRPRFSLP